MDTKTKEIELQAIELVNELPEQPMTKLPDESGQGEDPRPKDVNGRLAMVYLYAKKRVAQIRTEREAEYARFQLELSRNEAKLDWFYGIAVKDWLAKYLAEKNGVNKKGEPKKKSVLIDQIGIVQLRANPRRSEIADENALRCWIEEGVSKGEIKASDFVSATVESATLTQEEVDQLMAAIPQELIDGGRVKLKERILISSVNAHIKGTGEIPDGVIVGPETSTIIIKPAGEPESEELAANGDSARS